MKQKYKISNDKDLECGFSKRGERVQNSSPACEAECSEDSITANLHSQNSFQTLSHGVHFRDCKARNAYFQTMSARQSQSGNKDLDKTND